MRICRKTYLKLRLINLSTTVFAFCINPKNTPLWLDSVATEKANQWPITVGTIYKNQNKLGKWSTYTVTVFIENEVFELASNDKNYHVRYTNEPIDNKSSELEYYEWVERGELQEPFTQEVLEKLKQVLKSVEEK